MIFVNRKFGFIGAEWARNYDEAIARLSKGDVTFASLDHDIGACPECTKNNLHIGDMKTPDTTFLNTCPHAKNGYDVVCWMEENNVWPPDGVVIHSQNPAGKKRITDPGLSGDFRPQFRGVGCTFGFSWMKVCQLASLNTKVWPSDSIA